MPPETQTPEAPEQTGTPTSPTTPEPGAPVTEPPGTGSPSESPEDIDWKQRYEDLRPEADRRASLIADIEGRNGPDRQRQALADHARIELAEEEEEAEEPEFGEDEFDLRDPNEEIDAIRQELAERDERASEAEFDQLEREYTERTVEALEESENVKLSDEGYDLVVNYGLAHRDPHDGKPDFEGGFAALKAERQAANASYLQSKETFVPPVGTEGEPKIDLRDKEARQKVMTEAYEAHSRSQEP
jgi:hypothetical protein